MINRIVTFGCSLTFGYYLEDCPKDSLTPSKFSWPSVLAKKLNKPVLNLSEQGSSNKQIWKSIVDANLTEFDCVIVLWSHIERWCVFLSEEEKNKIGPWNSLANKRSNAFFKYFFNSYDMNIDMSMRSSYVQLYLDRLNIKHYQMISRPMYYPPKYKWNNVEYLPIDYGKIRNSNPLASDNKHPGREAHEIYANEIYKYIKNDLS